MIVYLTADGLWMMELVHIIKIETSERLRLISLKVMVERVRLIQALEATTKSVKNSYSITRSRSR